MLFLRQVRFEIKNILKVKFILILALLIAAGAVIIPLLGYLFEKRFEKMQQETIYYDVVSPEMVGRPYATDQRKGESITLDGVTVYMDNPLFWDLQMREDEKQYVAEDKDMLRLSASKQLALDLLDAESRYYLLFAKHITDYRDFRYELAYQADLILYERFFLAHSDAGLAVLEEVGLWRRGLDADYMRSHYVDLSPQEHQAALARAQANYEALERVVEHENLADYVALRTRLYEDEVAQLEDSIRMLEKNIVENPHQEEYLSLEIDDLKRMITDIQTNIIPLLDYRLSQNVFPGTDSWQNRAIEQIESARRRLASLVILPEDEWLKQRPTTDFYFGMPDENQTYPEYVATLLRQQNALNKELIVAQKSLDSGKPDMVFLPNAARSRTVGFLDYSAAILLFGVLVGGWLMASEYQQGTIRLLMIRPRTRTAILLAKFTAAIAVWFILALVSHLLNLLLNGALYGFSDFFFPNYSVNGQISFWAFFPPRFLACLLPVLFSFTAAYMISVLMKNTAVSVALPFLFYVGSMITMNIVIFSGKLGWLVYTPLPFMQMAGFFTPNSTIQSFVIDMGLPISLGFGVFILLAFSFVFTAVTTLVFKKRDITN